MSRWLLERGVDCSAGGATPATRSSMGNRTANQVALSAQIRQTVGIKTMAGGVITEARQAEEIIASGKADIALMARQSLGDPYWPIHGASELGIEKKADDANTK